MDLSFSRIIRAALLSGVGGIGDVLFIPLFPGRPAEAVIPVIEPIKDKQGRMVGLATLWVKAKTVEDIVKKGTVLGGQGSSFMVLDRHGIRIAHSVPEKVLYRPTGPLPDADRRRMVAEQRFGPDTKECLAKVLAFPEVYERAAAENPDTRMFEGQSGSNDEVYVGMGRRLETVPWTVFLMHPGGDVNQPVIAVFRKVAVWCVPVVLLGLGIGGLVLRGTLRDRRGRSGGLRS